VYILDSEHKAKDGEKLVRRKIIAKKIKRDDGDYDVWCAYCGTHFVARRKDATFCSDRCRMAYGRQDDSEHLAIEAMNAINMLKRDVTTRDSVAYKALLIIGRDLAAFIKSIPEGENNEKRG